MLIDSEILPFASLRGGIGRKNLAGLSTAILTGLLTELAPPIERAEALKE